MAENERIKGDGLEAFRRWLTPMLILISGYLIGRKMDEIDKKLDLVNVIQAAQAVLSTEINNLKDKQNKLENRFDDHEKGNADKIYQEAEKNLRRTAK